METKREIRKKIRCLRKELEPELWREKTEEVFKRVISHPLYRQADTLYCYVDFNRETGTGLLMEHAWKLGKKVAVPRTWEEKMEFYYIRSFEELSPGGFGIPEPEEDPAAQAPGSRGLVIVPGVAFDEQGNRIGYGKGYYDRYLSHHPGLDTMAVAFEFQVYPSVPAEEFDRKMDVLITEKRTIDYRKEEK